MIVRKAEFPKTPISRFSVFYAKFGRLAGRRLGDACVRRERPARRADARNQAARTPGLVASERRKPGMRYSEIALRHAGQLQRQGDWLSGRAPRSHRGGHWFDPSIAHQVRASPAVISTRGGLASE